MLYIYIYIYCSTLHVIILNLYTVKPNVLLHTTIFPRNIACQREISNPPESRQRHFFLWLQPDVSYLPNISLPEGQRKTEEMTKLAQIIDENLHVLENRLNVVAVYPSYKISNAEETNDLCITVSVFGKRKIPVGEKDFSEVELLGGYPFDIVEGYFASTNGPILSKAYPLHFGVGIGVQGRRGGFGTLGTFLTDEENYFVLSCQHVLLESDKRSIEQPAKKDFKKVRKNLRRSVRSKKEHLEGRCDRMDGLINDREKKILERQIKEAERELENQEEQFDDLVKLGRPRHIATYFVGLQTNYSHAGKIFFVDAAVAKISDSELDQWRS